MTLPLKLYCTNLFCSSAQDGTHPPSLAKSSRKIAGMQSFPWSHPHLGLEDYVSLCQKCVPRSTSSSATSFFFSKLGRTANICVTVCQWCEFSGKCLNWNDFQCPKFYTLSNTPNVAHCLHVSNFFPQCSKYLNWKFWSWKIFSVKCIWWGFNVPSNPIQNVSWKLFLWEYV